MAGQPENDDEHEMKREESRGYISTAPLGLGKKIIIIMMQWHLGLSSEHDLISNVTKMKSQSF